jgi:hypothetical protein
MTSQVTGNSAEQAANVRKHWYSLEPNKHEQIGHRRAALVYKKSHISNEALLHTEQ